MNRSRVGVSLTAALLLGGAMLTGCGGMNNASTGNHNVHSNTVAGQNDGRIVQEGEGRHKIGSMEMNRELADRIEAVSGVRAANVVTTGHSAYVAVTLDSGAGGGTGRGVQMNGVNDMRAREYASRARGMNAGGFTGDNTTGGRMNDDLAGNGMTNGMTNGGMQGKGMNRGGMNRSGRNEAGTHGNGMGTRGVGMRSADTGMTGRATAPGRMYGSDDQGNVTREMKDRIADVVKQHNADIQNVYVSANPDFVERVNGYGEKFQAGHPMAGFISEFSTMVERMFPSRSGH